MTDFEPLSPLEQILQDPESDWSDIRQAMKSQGCTNMAVINGLTRGSFDRKGSTGSASAASGATAGSDGFGGFRPGRRASGDRFVGGLERRASDGGEYRRRNSNESFASYDEPRYGGYPCPYSPTQSRERTGRSSEQTSRSSTSLSGSCSSISVSAMDSDHEPPRGRAGSTEVKVVATKDHDYLPSKLGAGMRHNDSVATGKTMSMASSDWNDSLNPSDSIETSDSVLSHEDGHQEEEEKEEEESPDVPSRDEQEDTIEMPTNEEEHRLSLRRSSTLNTGDGSGTSGSVRRRKTSNRRLSSMGSITSVGTMNSVDLMSFGVEHPEGVIPDDLRDDDECIRFGGWNGRGLPKRPSERHLKSDPRFQISDGDFDIDFSDDEEGDDDKNTFKPSNVVDIKHIKIHSEDDDKKDNNDSGYESKIPNKMDFDEFLSKSGYGDDDASVLSMGSDLGSPTLAEILGESEAKAASTKAEPAVTPKATNQTRPKQITPPVQVAIPSREGETVFKGNLQDFLNTHKKPRGIFGFFTEKRVHDSYIRSSTMPAPFTLPTASTPVASSPTKKTDMKVVFAMLDEENAKQKASQSSSSGGALGFFRRLSTGAPPSQPAQASPFSRKDSTGSNYSYAPKTKHGYSKRASTGSSAVETVHVKQHLRASLRASMGHGTMSNDELDAPRNINKNGSSTTFKPAMFNDPFASKMSGNNSASSNSKFNNNTFRRHNSVESYIPSNRPNCEEEDNRPAIRINRDDGDVDIDEMRRELYREKKQEKKLRLSLMRNVGAFA